MKNTMDKRKLVISGILAISILVLSQVIYRLVKLAPYEYRPAVGYDNRYSWIFKDSVASELKKKYSISNKNDAIYIYEYKRKYSFFIWELSECRNVNIEDIKINSNYSFAKLSPPVTFFSYNDPNIDVEFKTKHSLSTLIGINLESGCEVFKDLNFQKFRYVHGRFTKFGFSNELGEVQFILTYRDFPVSSDIIFYKARNSFFIIVIRALGEKKIDENTLNPLKLE